MNFVCHGWRTSGLNRTSTMSIFRLLMRRSHHASAEYRRLLHISVRLCRASAVVTEPVKHCYAILNVSSACSNDELRTAYLHLVKIYHPDSISGQANAAKFAEVEDAYRRILVSTCLLVLCCSFWAFAIWQMTSDDTLINPSSLICCCLDEEGHPTHEKPALVKSLLSSWADKTACLCRMFPVLPDHPYRSTATQARSDVLIAILFLLVFR